MSLVVILVALYSEYTHSKNKDEFSSKLEKQLIDSGVLSKESIDELNVEYTQLKKDFINLYSRKGIQMSLKEIVSMLSEKYPRFFKEFTDFNMFLN